MYVPYSVQMPDHYKEMQAYQLRCSERQAWWYSENRSSQLNLPEELSAAISAPLVIPQRPQADWQTSETHPIVYVLQFLFPRSPDIRVAGVYCAVQRSPVSTHMRRLLLKNAI